MQLTRKVGLVLAFLTLLGLIASGPSQAQVTEYLSRTAFTAASSNLTTLDFANANPGGGVLTEYNTAAGLTLGGVNFVGTLDGAYTLSAVTPDFYPTYQAWNGNPTVLTDGLVGVTTRPAYAIMTVTLPSGITSVGTNLYTTYGTDGSSNSASPVSFSLYSGASQIGAFNVSTFGKPTLAFVGFKSSLPITSMQMIADNTNLYSNLSGFTFGSNASPVPESSTLVSTGLLFCLGLGALAVNVRRRKVPSAE